MPCEPESGVPPKQRRKYSSLCNKCSYLEQINKRKEEPLIVLQIKACREENETPAMVSSGPELLSAKSAMQEARGHVFVLRQQKSQRRRRGVGNTWSLNDANQ